mmetsp:Transcript_19548/g.59144  ORF Transcript_19548/g.59144 Transcript_19548/m.59144 type:complete len:512 (+) Transcript_19548:224-1759(+)
MLAGESCLDVLATLHPAKPIFVDHSRAKLAEAVTEEVDGADAVDVHAYCLAPEWGEALAKFGIDELLTAAYGDKNLACSADLVAQYLSVADDTVESFRDLLPSEQADAVWRELFVRRSPLSDACSGVITTLEAIGLREAVAKRDLRQIREWYSGQDAAKFVDKAMRLAKLKYVVTSHSPFFSNTQLLLALRSSCGPQTPRHRAALELDALLEGDWPRVLATLSDAGEKATLRGLVTLLYRLATGLRPEYLSCSTPHDFAYTSEIDILDMARTEAHLEGAPCDNDQVSCNSGLTPSSRCEGSQHCGGWQWAAFDQVRDIHPDAPIESCPPTPSQLLDVVLLPLCRLLNIPLLLRMGTRRGMNAMLQLAGDGSGAAHLDAIARLCARHPKTKFLLTVLDASQQHEAAVIASRFANIHLWGSWWYAGLPSLAAEGSAVRLELLGTQFTFCASSAKLHDQLIYKWRQGRKLLARLLTDKYSELVDKGWRISRADIRRDVQTLLGGAYEDFLRKKL